VAGYFVCQQDYSGNYGLISLKFLERQDRGSGQKQFIKLRK